MGERRQTAAVTRRDGRNRRLVAAVAAAAGILLILLVAVLLLGRGPGDTVLEGVAVEGRDVGGATRAELERAVEELADQRLDQPVEVVAERGEVSATRGDAGEEVDVDATVAEAWSRGRGGGLAGLRDRIRARLGATVAVDLRARVDGTRARAWAADASDALSVPPREGEVELVASEPPAVEVTEPVTGEVVDVDDLHERLAAALRRDDGPVRLEAPAERREPEITQADVEAVVPRAERAISAPVELENRADGKDLVLAPVELAELLVIERRPAEPEGQRLRVATGGAPLRDVLGEERLAQVEAEPTEAELVVEGEEVRIVGGETGFALDAEAAAQRILELATAEGPRRGELPGETAEPRFSRADAEALGITERISTFTTEYGCCPPRVTNIRRMAELVDGAVVAPGDPFTLNTHVGPRTEEKGFVAGGVIEDGELTEAVGGGVSQFATTFFNAAWFAGVQIDAFQPHSYYFERYPMGRESTIHFGAIDVAITNDSPHGILIHATATDTAVTVSFYSTEWAQVDSFTGEPYDVVEGEVRDGFTVDFGRTVTYPDREPHSEEHTHTYEPQDTDEDEDAEDTPSDEGS